MVAIRARSTSSSTVLPYIRSDSSIDSPPHSRELIKKNVFSAAETVSKRRGSLNQELPTLSPSMDRSQGRRRLSPSRSNLYTNRLYHNENKRGFSFATVLAIVIATAVAFIAGSGLAKEQLGRELSTLENERDRLADAQSSLNAQLTRAQKRLKEEVRVMDEAKQKAGEEALQREANFSKETIALTSTYESKLHDLESSIQAMARQQVISKYGEGPHYAKFSLIIGGIGRRFFTIEFASLQHMPVTVSNFMNQIDKGLWDNTSFYLKADHVLIARPVSWDGRKSTRESFGDLSNLPFQEYSNEFPHDAYTLGLNGQPSGPDWYINLMDNAIPHGPAGHQENGSAEPCFAKIVQGMKTIDYISTLPSKGSDKYLLRRAVEISKVEIVSEVKQWR